MLWRGSGNVQRQERSLTAATIFPSVFQTQTFPGSVEANIFVLAKLVLFKLRIMVVAAVSGEIKDAEDSCSSLQSEEAVEKEEHGGGGGGGGEEEEEGRLGEGGHSKDRSSGFQQVDKHLGKY